MDLNKSFTPEEEKDLAQTPREYVRAFEIINGIKFNLDVCALQQTAKCERYYSLLERNENSLELDWSGLNYCNPPYSDVTPWVEKAFLEAKCGRTSVLLIPDKPEVKYMQFCHNHADTIYHMDHRLNFLRPNGKPFLTEKGKKQGPKFAVCWVVFSPFATASVTSTARHAYLFGMRNTAKQIKEAGI